LDVLDCTKAAGGRLNVHTVTIQEGGGLKVGEEVTAEVDSSYRQRTKCNHTATHLLQV
jgi:alanyl-tRNA synthetase